MIKIYNGDCLIENKHIEDGSVDLILTDLPYGTIKGLFNDKEGNSKTNWDNVINTEEIYKLRNRILRKNGKMVLFCQEPFTYELMSKSISNISFNQRLIWKKDNSRNMLMRKKRCVNFYEDILVFSKNHEYEQLHPLRYYFKEVLNFINIPKKHINKKLGHRKTEHSFEITTTQFSLCTEKSYIELTKYFNLREMESFKEYEELKKVDNEFKEKFKSTFNLWEGKKYKSNILEYKKDYNGYHPTQKPVLLLEDLIKTYSNEGNLVVDLTMGSGSTGVRCVNTNRNFIGIEMDKDYFDIRKKRINKQI